ncbi:MAG TPA: rod shape-determining protein MreC [Caldilineales bacterium]|nr:rod shape-determining protein MreC [Caldilineales bacterium]
MIRARLRPLILPLMILGAIVIMGLDMAGFLGPMDDLIHTAIKPPAIFFSEARRVVGSGVATLREVGDLKQRNLELEARVNQLTVENLRLAEVETENAQLRALLDFAQTNPSYDIRGGQIIARVIGDGANLFTHPIQIDLGEIHGIRQGMPVVTDRGLAGRIAHVYSRSSDILLITDPRSNVNVMTQASRAQGVLRGRVGQPPIMEFISPDIAISEGEIIITSGLGGHFPKGLVVGQVVEVIHNDNLMFQSAVIQPTVDFDRMELVLVITNFPPEEPEVLPPPTPSSP